MYTAGNVCARAGILHATLASLAILVVLAAATPASAVPLSVRIDDHDFTYDTDFLALYMRSFEADQRDRLVVAPQVAEGSAHHEVGSYRYLGVSATPVPAVTPGFYPIANLADGSFGGDLELELVFDSADGPYVSGGDSMPVSLTGNQGILRIRGELRTPAFAPFASPITGTLLEIVFTKTSLLAREDDSVIDLVEAFGNVTTLLGQNVSGQGVTGTMFLKFYASDGSVDIFPSPGESYDPLAVTTLNNVVGRVSGEAGDGYYTVPEPASVALLLAGGAGMMAGALRRRRA